MAKIGFPHPQDPASTVEWTGAGFNLAGQQVAVLNYHVNPSGGTDELTNLHEHTGGSDHFIDVASRDHAKREVLRRVQQNPSGVTLEVGVSSGFLLSELRQLLPGQTLIGADYTRGTLESLAKRLPVPLLQFDLTKWPLPMGSVDILVLINVLDNIDRHDLAIEQCARILRHGGAMIVEVPAGPLLFEVYDRVLMHFRRYRMAALTELMQRYGFVIERKSHLGALLYPGFAVTKLLNRVRYRRPHSRSRGAARGGADRIHPGPRRHHDKGHETRGLSAVQDLPAVGIRCLVTGRKR